MKSPQGFVRKIVGRLANTTFILAHLVIKFFRKKTVNATGLPYQSARHVRLAGLVTALSMLSGGQVTGKVQSYIEERYDRQQIPTTEGQAHGRTYYVRISGNDNNSGRSPQQAWRTIARACRTVRPGDTVYVGAGEYQETITCTTPGLPNRVISLIADTTGTNTGDAGTVAVLASNNYSFVFSRVAYYYLRGFTFRSPGNAVNYGNYLASSSDITFENCRFEPGVYLGVVAVESDINVTSCVFDGVRSYPVISYYSSVTVSATTIVRSGGYAVLHVSRETSAKDVVLKDSIITDNYGGPYVTFGKLTIENTRIEHNRYWGIVCAYSTLTFRRQTPGVNNNGYGLYLVGRPNVPIVLDGYSFTGNGSYALFAVSCDLKLRQSSVQQNGGWAIVLMYSTLDGAGSAVSENANGVLVYSNKDNSPLAVRNIRVSGNSGVGLYHYSDPAKPGKLVVGSCNFDRNGNWAVLSYYGDVSMVDCPVTNNYAGVFLYAQRQTSGTKTHTIDGCTIRANSYGVYTYASDVRITNSSIVNNSNGYAVYSQDDAAVDWSSRVNVVLRNCIITGNFSGPCVQYSHLRLDRCRLEQNRQWAIVCMYGNLVLDKLSRPITDNKYGVYVAGDAPQGKRVFRGVNVSNNEAYGFYFADCEVEVRDCQVEGMRSWAMAVNGASVSLVNSPIRSNGHGVLVYSNAANRHRPKLRGAVIESNSGYGLYHAGSWQSPDRVLLSECLIRKNGSWSFISYYGDATINNCQFRENGGGLYLYRHRQYGGAGAHDISGAAIENCSSYGLYVHHGNVQVSDTTITGNRGGYALYAAEDGSVAWNSRVRVILRNCSIMSNYGGPYVHHAKLTIDNCRIEQNTYWAVVCNQGDFEIINQAYALKNNGYGLYLAGDGPQGTRVLRGMDVSENGAYGIYASDCQLELRDCRIEQMRSWAVALDRASLTATNSPIRNNAHGLLVYTNATARYRPAIQGAAIEKNKGYGIYNSGTWQSPDTLTVSDCTITGNGSWALISYYANVSVSKSLIADNQAGVYLYRARQNGGVGSHLVTDCTISNSGTGIYAYYSHLNVVRSNINGNATAYAVYVHDDPSVPWSERVQAVVRSCIMESNYGGPYVYAAKLTLDNCRIQGNRYWGVVCDRGDFSFVSEPYAIKNNGYGLYLAGDGPDGIRRIQGLDVSENGAYGIYASDCRLELYDCRIEKISSWAVALVGSSLTANNSPIRYCAHGIVVVGSGQSRYRPALRDVVVEDNSGYGVYYSGSAQSPDDFILDKCAIRRNKGWSVVSYYANVTMTNCVISDGGAGVYLYRHRSYGGPGCHKLLDSSITGCASHAVYAYHSSVDLSNCQLKGNTGGYALYGYDERSTPWQDRVVLAMKDCTVEGNYGGPYADNAHLVLQNTHPTGHRYWAIACRYGDLRITDEPPTISNNGYGLYLAGNPPGGKRVLKNFTFVSNGVYSLYVQDCNLVLENSSIKKTQSWAVAVVYGSLIATDSVISEAGNGLYVVTRSDLGNSSVSNLVISKCGNYGIYHYSTASAPAQLSLSNCRIDGYAGYGVLNYYGRLAMDRCTLSGMPQSASYGIYGYMSDAIVVDSTTVYGNRGWAVVSYGNNLLLRNSVLANSGNGLYTYHYPGRGTASQIWNCTVGNCPGYGLYQQFGSCEILNTIIAANNGSYALVNQSGTMYHANNILFGYRRLFYGTSQGEGEILSDPRFTDPSAGDYSITANSSAINQGRDMSGKVEVDLAGVSRPVAQKWDIGAYEYPYPAGSVRVINWIETR